MKYVSFVRIPKNASTSVYTFFGETNTIRNEYLDADNETYLNLFEPSHCTLEGAVKELGKEVLEFPVVAVVRNPYDRLVSMYFFARKYGLGSLYSIRTDNFEDFAEDFYKESTNPNFFHAYSQKCFVGNVSDNCYVCRFETLENDIEDFLEEEGLDSLYDMSYFPKLNSTDHLDYRTYYTDNSKRIVEQLWGEDLEEYEYSFSLGDNYRSNT